MDRMDFETSNMIDLKPDSSLLDATFDGYKLSLDPFPSYNHSLPLPVRELQTSNMQYGLEHIKLFSDINYLTFDPFSSDSTHKNFIIVLQDYHLCSISFDVQTKKFTVSKNHPVITVPVDYAEREDRYPATVSFPDAHHAFVSNGFGHLTMYNTGDRRTESTWKEFLSVEPFTVNGKMNAFVITESKCMGNRYDILLRTVTPGKKSDQGNFLNKAIWLTVINENGKMTLNEFCGVISSGHIEMITFDRVPESLIVVGTGDLNFDDDGMDALNVVEQSIKKDPADNAINVAKKKYAWSQTTTDVTAVFNCSETISKKDVSLSLSATSVHLSVKGRILIGGTLGGLIDPTSSTYTIDNDKLELFLSKSGTSLCNWTELVLGDDFGAYEVDLESLKTASELLERFTCESQELSGNGIGHNFNIDQLEDCDTSTEDICRIRWLNCASKTVAYESDITGHSILFSTCLDSGPRYLCIRRDVDGILWKFTEESRKVQHYATFCAFGYVQASKTQRRFSACPPDCCYVVIVEARRHAFVYWQPATISSDLRNRKTGRRVAGIAKQQLISLSKCLDFEDSSAVTDNIVGVHAENDFLFILTTADIFAIHLRR